MPHTSKLVYERQLFIKSKNKILNFFNRYGLVYEKMVSWVKSIETIRSTFE